MATQTARRENAMNGVRATQRAVQALIAEYPERYEELRRQQRVAIGLPPNVGGKSPDKIRQQIEKAQEKIDKLNAELAKLNGG